jgi:hypothetical protein
MSTGFEVMPTEMNPSNREIIFDEKLLKVSETFDVL